MFFFTIVEISFGTILPIRLSANSTTLTFFPSCFAEEAISRPINPPPIIKIFSELLNLFFILVLSLISLK